MVSTEYGRVEITICSGVASSNEHLDMPRMPGEMADPGQSKEHGKVETPCAFSGLSMPALDAVDPLLLFAAFRFAVTVGLRPLRSLARPLTPYLRPHSQGLRPSFETFSRVSPARG